MGWGFRQRMRVTKGVTLNLGKKSAGLRIGPRGAGVTIGTAGSRVSATIPETGISVEQRLGKKSRKAKQATPDNDKIGGPAPQQRSALATIVYGLIFGGVLIGLISLFS
jgi:hypothetical protein